MRAYAVVKKPTPTFQEHVIKFTKEEPKISIEPISENRFVALHKGGNEVPVHQLGNKGSYFKMNYEGQERQSKVSERNNEDIKDHASSSSVKEGKVQEAVLAVLQQEPKSPKVNAQPVERESLHKVPRTKRLFQQFPVSPALQESFNQSNGKDTIDPPTPVKLLKDNKIGSFPVQAQPANSQSRSSKTDNIMEKLRIEEGSEMKPQAYENYQEANIVYQSNSKSIFCCGSVLSSESNHQSRPQPQRRTHLFVPFGSGDVSHSRSSNKHKIFQQFQPKSNSIPAVPQDFTFKQPKLVTPSPQSQPQQRRIKVKIYEFSNMIAFDI